MVFDAAFVLSNPGLYSVFNSLTLLLLLKLLSRNQLTPCSSSPHKSSEHSFPLWVFLGSAVALTLALAVPQNSRDEEPEL